MQATGGSWGAEPDDGDVVAACVRGTDFDMTRLRANLQTAPTRGFAPEEFNRRRLKAGDLIIEKSGGGDYQPVGRVVLYDSDEPAVPTNFAARLRPGRDIEPRFMCYVMASLYSDGRTRSVIKQTTGIQNLDLDALLDEPVPIPAFQRQRAIASFLDAETARIDALIAKRRRQADLIHDRVNVRISLVYEDATEKWGAVKLARLLRSMEQGWSPQCEDRPADPDEFGVLKSSCVNGGLFSADQHKTLPSDQKVRTQYLVKPGDFLVSRASGSLDLIGSAAVVSQNTPRNLLLCDKLYRLHFLDYDPQFAAAMFRARPIREAIRIGTSGAEGMANNVPSGTIRALTMPAAPISRQLRIVEDLTEAESQASAAANAINTSISLLRERRQALIMSAVSGELDVPGAT
jgi:type I restriction enzyme S subunit